LVVVSTTVFVIVGRVLSSSGEGCDGFRSVSLCFCSICFYFDMFGGGFALFLFLDLSFRWWWCFNAAGGGVGVIWFTHSVLEHVLFVEGLEWFCIPFAVTDLVLLLVQHLGGDSDGSEMDVMRVLGVVVATDLSWACWWWLRQI
jgi:hypothetical protein